MEWREKMMKPVRRVYFGVTTHFRIRKSGLLKLQGEVRTCEYEDIQVMWEMLNRSGSKCTETPIKRGKKKKMKKNKNKGNCCKMIKWVKLCCSS